MIDWKEGTRLIKALDTRIHELIAAPPEDRERCAKELRLATARMNAYTFRAALRAWWMQFPGAG